MRCSFVVSALGLVLTLLVLAAGSPGVALAGTAPADGAVWAQVRSQLPPGVAVLAPTWLPARFAAASSTAVASNSAVAGPECEVTYRDTAGENLLFALGATNSARPERIRSIAIRGTTGQLEVTPGWPSLAVVWREGTWQGKPLVYTVQARGVSEDELLRIVGSLAPVGVAATVPNVPAAGAGGMAGTGEGAVLLAAALAGGLVLAGRLGYPHRHRAAQQ